MKHVDGWLWQLTFDIDSKLILFFFFCFRDVLSWACTGKDVQHVTKTLRSCENLNTVQKCMSYFENYLQHS